MLVIYAEIVRNIQAVIRLILCFKLNFLNAYHTQSCFGIPRIVYLPNKVIDHTNIGRESISVPQQTYTHHNGAYEGHQLNRVGRAKRLQLHSPVVEAQVAEAMLPKPCLTGL